MSWYQSKFEKLEKRIADLTKLSIVGLTLVGSLQIAILYKLFM